MIEKKPSWETREVPTQAISLIKSFESLRLKAYLCPAGKPTIGWGHTEGVKLGDVITVEQAEELLMADVTKFMKDVLSLVKVPLTDNQLSALISFTFNVGPDIDSDDIAEGLGDSTLLKLLNKGYYEQVPIQLMRWNKAKGEEMGGLTRRRKAEIELWNKSVFNG